MAPRVCVCVLVTLLLQAQKHDNMGIPVVDHMFLAGFPEMRDAGSEDHWRSVVVAQLPNGTRMVSDGWVVLQRSVIGRCRLTVPYAVGQCENNIKDHSSPISGQNHH